MKKAPARKSVGKRDTGLARQYRLDYAKARPNRFAKHMKTNSLVVVLDPDVASVFKSSEAVNELLKSVMSAMPQR